MTAPATPDAQGPLPGRTRRTPVWLQLLVGIFVSAVTLALLSVLEPEIAGALLLLVVLSMGLHRRLLSPHGLLGTLVLVIMLIPIRRYAIPAGLPFQLEPYRILMVALVVGVAVSLLVDPRIRLRPLGHGALVGGFLLVNVLASGVNGSDLTRDDLAGNVAGTLVNLTLIFGLFLVARLLMTGWASVHLVLMLLVGCGAVVGLSSVYERATGYNVFLNLQTFLPLQLLANPTADVRVGGFRALGSAGHPIALSVLLTFMVPLAAYLARWSPWPTTALPRQVTWSAAAVLCLIGALVTVSRTGVVLVAVMLLMALLLKPRVLPHVALVGVPGVMAMMAVAPTALIGLVRDFSSPSALLASQRTSAGTTGSGRLADFGPTISQIAEHPVLGIGQGSRIVTGPQRNALILDNQFLSSGLEIGLIGLAVLLLLLLVPVFMNASAARRATVDPRRQDLHAAIATSLLVYGVSLYFYDGFGFFQPLIVWLLLLACSGWLRTEGASAPLPPEPATRSRQRSAVS